MADYNHLMPTPRNGLMAAEPQRSGSPISDYAEWIKRALNSRDTGDDFLGGMYLRPPAKDEQVNYPVRPDEVRSAPEPVWPPRSWWDEKGIMPSYQDRVGASQAFLGKALDWWGVPSAALKRVSPDASNALTDITAAHPTAKMAGSVAGIGLGMPVLRTAGNALAARGHGTLTQGGADATTAVGLGLLADGIKGDLPTGMNTYVAASHVAPVAMANRVFMPNLPDSIFKRGAIGSGVGLMTAMPDVFTGNYSTAPINAILGGAMAAAGRPNANQKPYSHFRDDSSHAGMRERSRDINIGLTGVLGAGSYVGQEFGAKSAETPLTTEEAKEFAMTQYLPPNPFPPPRPYIREEYGYNEPNWPPRDPAGLMEYMREPRR